MDFTQYTDEELRTLTHEIAVEQHNRAVILQTTQSIAHLTKQYLDLGGVVEDVKAAVDEGELAKAKADEEKAKEEEEANNPPVEPVPVEPVEPVPVEPAPTEPIVDPKPKA